MPSRRWEQNRGTVVVTADLESTLMKLAQRLAMSDADYGSAWQTLCEQPVKCCFRLLIQRRCRFVHEEPCGLMQQRAGECDTLLFAPL
jgi:hypothetical protein